MSRENLYEETTADASLLALISKMEICSYSTAFSGIDSPGTAFAQLRAASGALSGNAVLDPEHLHAVVPWYGFVMIFSKPSLYDICLNETQHEWFIALLQYVFENTFRHHHYQLVITIFFLGNHFTPNLDILFYWTLSRSGMELLVLSYNTILIHRPVCIRTSVVSWTQVWLTSLKIFKALTDWCPIWNR